MGTMLQVESLIGKKKNRKPRQASSGLGLLALITRARVGEAAGDSMRVDPTRNFVLAVMTCYYTTQAHPSSPQEMSGKETGPIIGINRSGS